MHPQATGPSARKEALRASSRAMTGVDEALTQGDDEPGQSWLTNVGAWLSPAMFLVMWFAPLPLSTDAHRLAAIASAVLVAWVTEVIPVAVTALLIAPALVFTGVMPAKKAFAAFSDPILFLFVGSFFAARAM